MAIRIVLVDDHLLLRSGLMALLANTPGYVVVGEADDARAAYGVIEATRPDVVVADLGLPGESGIAMARELVRRDRHARVLILTAHVSPEYAAQALTAGALGYVLKHDSAEQLLAAIARVAAGERVVAPRLSAQLRAAAVGDGGGPLESLSVREREVFEMLVRGLVNTVIAKHLFISVKTVETHRTHVLRKLELHSLSDMIRFAARHGLLIEDGLDGPVAARP